MTAQPPDQYRPAETPPPRPTPSSTPETDRPQVPEPTPTPVPPPRTQWAALEPAAPASPAPGVRYAGFWIRLLAYLIDLIPFVLVSAILLVPLFGALAEAFRDLPPLPPLDEPMSEAAQRAWEVEFNRRLNEAVVPLYPVSGLLQLLSIAYYVAFWTWRGQTPGMMLLGLRVARETDGSPPGLGRSVLRYVGYILSSLPLGLGFIWIAFDSRKQGWHDKLAGTVVVRRAS